jgi:hypothetical protein
VAVLTDLQNIYPAENRPLATDILNSGGVLVSEMPLGQWIHRSAFVQRELRHYSHTCVSRKIRVAGLTWSEFAIAVTRSCCSLLWRNSCATPCSGETALNPMESSLVKKGFAALAASA